MNPESARVVELQRASAALQKTIDALSNLESLDSFIPQVLRIVADAFGSPSAGYWEHPDRNIYLRYWLFAGKVLGPSELPGLSGAEYDLLARMAQGFTVAVEHLGVDHVWRTSASIVHHAMATATPEMHAFCRTMGWDWELNVPLVVRGRAEGALSLFRSESAPFSAADIALAEELAKYIALAMKVSRVAEREREVAVARERAAELSKANEALRLSLDCLASAPDSEQFLGQVLRVAAQQTQVALAHLWVHDEVGRVWLRLGFCEGEVFGEADCHRMPLADLYAQPFQVPIGLIGGELIHHRSRHFVSDLFENSLYAQCLSAEQLGIFRRLGVQTEINVPLRFGGRCVGHLAVYLPPGQAVRTELVELVDALGHQATLALELGRLSEQAKATAVLHEREHLSQQRTVELERTSSALQKTIDALSRVQSIDAFMPEVLRIVSDALGQGDAAYFEHEPDLIRLRYWMRQGKVLRPLELEALEGTELALLSRLARGFTVPPEHLGTDFRTRTRTLLMHRSKAPGAPDALAFARKQGWDWELNVPLVVAGVAEGALVVYRSDAEPFTATDIALAEQLAKQIALAMKICRAAERERELALIREQELAMNKRALALRQANDALRRSTAQLVSSDNLSQFLDVVLQEAIAAAGAVSGSVFLCKPPECALRAVSMVLRGDIIDIGRDPRASLWRHPIDTRGTVWWQALSQRREVWWIDCANPIPGDYPPAAAWHVEAGHRFVACLPMTDNEQVIGFLGFCYDVSMVNQPDDQRLELCEVLAQQATLAVRMAELSAEGRRAAVLDERARLAREVHDGIVQSFIGIRMQLQKSPRFSGDEAIGRAMKLAAQGLTEARRAVRALRPWQLLHRSFQDALCELAGTTLGDGVRLETKQTGPWEPLAQDLEGHLFRILQEALNNVAKHSAATVVSIEVSVAPTGRSILIVDNGVGFNAASVGNESGFGLFSMRQRAESIGAELEIASQVGRGTQVLISLSTPAVQGWASLAGSGQTLDRGRDPQH